MLQEPERNIGNALCLCTTLHTESNASESLAVLIAARPHVPADEQSQEASEYAATRIQAISRGKNARKKTAKARRRQKTTFSPEKKPNEDDHRHRDGFPLSDESEHRGLVGEERRVEPTTREASPMATAVSQGVVIDRRAAKMIASLVDERVMVRDEERCLLFCLEGSGGSPESVSVADRFLGGRVSW